MITIGICDDDPKDAKGIESPALEREVLHYWGRIPHPGICFRRGIARRLPRRMDLISSFWILRWMD